jgi:putative ABC transport system permease protein
MPGSSASAMALYLTDAGLQTVPSELTADSVRVVAADGTDRGDLAEAVDTVVAEAGSADALTVQTVDQVVDEQLEAMSDSTNVLNTVGLAFGLLAAGVAALVISNTFNVLVASRTRVLALFRAVGATSGRCAGPRSSRASASASSAPCSASGSASASVGGSRPPPARSGCPSSRRCPSRPWLIVAGPAVGILVTVAAGLIPALRSSRVSPIEALRPVDVPAAAPRIRWFRATLALVLGIAGIALCLLGATQPVRALRHPRLLRLFVALLIGARAFVPPLVALLADMIGLITRRSPGGEAGRTFGEHRGRAHRLDDGCPAHRHHPGHGRCRRFGESAAHPRTRHRRGHSRRPSRLDRRPQRRRRRRSRRAR